MRKFLAFMLLAGAATPALAAGAPGDRPGWQSRGDSAQPSQSEDRSRGDRPRANRADRGSNAPVMRARPQVENRIGLRDRGDGVAPVVRVRPQIDSRVDFRGRGGDGNVRVNVEGSARADRADIERIRTARGESADTVRSWRGPRMVQPTSRGGDTDGARNWRGRIVEPSRIVGAPGLRQPDRPAPRVLRTRVPVVSDTPREGAQPRLRVEHRRTEPLRWSTRWRDDSRYDWRRWRDRHRSTFRLGIYSDPFGWGYRPYQIGWRLWPSYYSSRYWLNDPWQYRLPYAPPGTRWVRYYDDAVLVDTWTGEVVDVIYNFFW